jgi:hypothetical protein
MTSRKITYNPPDILPADEIGSDPLLARFAQYSQVLASTGVSIPKLLFERRELQSRLGSAEIEGGSDITTLRERADTLTAALVSAGRQRASACESLLSMADELRQSRAAEASQLSAIAQATLANFEMRWAHAVAELSRLHNEGALLGRLLRTSVPLPPPYIAAMSLDGKPQVVFAGHAEDDAVSLPQEVQEVSAKLQVLDDALALVASVAQSLELNERYIALQRARNATPILSGVYVVSREFTHIGTRFEPGMLINQDIMPPGLISRYLTGRHLTPLEGARVAA